MAGIGVPSRGASSVGRRAGASTRLSADSSVAGLNYEPGGPDLQTLHSLLRVVGDQLTSRDIKSLKLLYSSILSEQLMRPVTDGPTFFLALERIGRVDESNLKHVLYLLRLIKRHDLMRCLTLRKRKPVSSDAVVDYLERSTSFLTPSKRRKLDASPPTIDDDSKPVETSSADHPLVAKDQDPRCKRQPGPHRRQALKNGGVKRSLEAKSAVAAEEEGGGAGNSPGVKVQGGGRRVEGAPCGVAESTSSASESNAREKRTCDIRLRVRAEYCEHESALEGNVHSSKNELIERQFEKFMQANTILKSRDLGSIVCDIKFSELTYLDAFWRDYINGSLQEALRTVFITESLKQAVGQEPIKLLVNVDEDDYEAGRLVLLHNLVD